MDGCNANITTERTRYPAPTYYGTDDNGRPIYYYIEEKAIHGQALTDEGRAMARQLRESAVTRKATLEEERIRAAEAKPLATCLRCEQPYPRQNHFQRYCYSCAHELRMERQRKRRAKQNPTRKRRNGRCIVVQSRSDTDSTDPA